MPLAEASVSIRNCLGMYRSVKIGVVMNATLNFAKST